VIDCIPYAACRSIHAHSVFPTDCTCAGPNYSGPPMHTFSAFVNPYLATPAGAGVLTVASGADIPTSFPAGTTAIVFGPGEHRMAKVVRPAWPVFTLPSAVRVHLTMGTILYFAVNGTAADGAALMLEGFGIISGEEMLRCHDPEVAGGKPSCTNVSPQVSGTGERDVCLSRG
jgi:hypothetical protein